MCRHTVLEHYLFRFKGEMLLCLGVGSLFNHSRTPSLDYRIDRKELIIRFYAARDVMVTRFTQAIHLHLQVPVATAFMYLNGFLSCSKERSSQYSMGMSGLMMRAILAIYQERLACMITWIMRTNFWQL